VRMLASNHSLRSRPATNIRLPLIDGNCDCAIKSPDASTHRCLPLQLQQHFILLGPPDIKGLDRYDFSVGVAVAGGFRAGHHPQDDER
jgi:hypothetical protein